ncbi:MAG TPA: ATPase [Candidatus Eisenbergiella merdipullorum]|uniref:ATPase n=1 Tax=Candidatus Eisenbergiella merdipullorum TaxID=2838553 RepID=A0A9D2L1T7_9FIRM|nr:ATPase [Candidatus Eisenbergiella merdipullorum]
MIEKMEFLSIIGPKDQLDRVTEKYLGKYEIQLENTVGELKNLKNIVPNSESNPYREWIGKAQEAAAIAAGQAKPGAGGKTKNDPASAGLSPQEAMEAVQAADKLMEENHKQKTKLQAELKKKQGLLEAVRPYLSLHFELSKILRFQYIRFRFGRLPIGYYQKLKEYLQEDDCTIFEKCRVDDSYVWGIYFVPVSEAKKADAIYASMHFERFFIEDAYQGTVDEACQTLEKEIEALKQQEKDLDEKLADALKKDADRLLAAKDVIETQSSRFDIRKLAAFTRSKKETFFILCGWMTKRDAVKLGKELEADPELFVTLEENPDRRVSVPPTRLKNPALIRPFEMFVRMYGLPNYNEFDPTLFVAITYSIIFGAMFGDVGQGLCLLIGGFLLYHFKKLNLAAIISCCGFFSTIFGFLYGSVFGFEDVIPALWLRPTEAMTTLPFIGRLNTVFVVTIAIGMGLILLTMIFSIINAFRSREYGKALFDTNGLAGLVFYGAVVLVVVLFMTGNHLPAAIALVVLFVVPLLIIACKEPLTQLLEKKQAHLEEGPVMFVVQSFFELFEVCLSYFSNTLSFVRIGAFAVSHAAMMGVVLMLAGAENGGTGNLIVIVLGNIIVCGMEGLVVGIQVLRLEYYEFFSRFYKGDGREFKPYV